MDENLIIHIPSEMPIDILNLPFQHLQATAWQMARNSRRKQMQHLRKEHENLTEIDAFAISSVYQKIG